MDGVIWGNKVEETAKGKSLCGTTLCSWVGNTCTDREKEEKLHVALNNWLQKMCKVKREDARKMGELREEKRSATVEDEGRKRQLRLTGDI